MIRGHYIFLSILSMLFFIVSFLLSSYTSKMYSGTYDLSYDEIIKQPYVQITKLTGLFLALMFAYIIFVFLNGYIKIRQRIFLVTGIVAVLFTVLASLIDLIMVEGSSTSYSNYSGFFEFWSFLIFLVSVTCSINSSEKKLRAFENKDEMIEIIITNPFSAKYGAGENIYTEGGIEKNTEKSSAPDFFKLKNN